MLRTISVKFFPAGDAGPVTLAEGIFDSLESLVKACLAEIHNPAKMNKPNYRGGKIVIGNEYDTKAWKEAFLRGRIVRGNESMYDVLRECAEPFFDVEK
jgi:hypothetical protein